MVSRLINASMGGEKKLNIKVNTQKEGSITVFLSLILLLILSFLFTIIEGARVHTARVFADRAFTTAMDSVLAEYYGPLWEEYHLFGLYIGDKGSGAHKEQMEDKLMDNMSYTFTPNKDCIADENALELYDITTKNITVGEETLLIDYQGKLLIHEAVEYMKYREIGDGLAVLLDKLSLFEQPEKVSYIQKEKQKVEEELVEIDRGILQLMELYDGLMTNKKGIELKKDGALKTTATFIKKICYGEVRMDSVGINQEAVFLAQKESYVDPGSYYSSINNHFTQIEELLIQMEGLRFKIAVIEGTISEKEEELAVLNTMEDKSDEIAMEIKVLKKSIKELRSDIEALEEEIKTKQESVEAFSHTILSTKASLMQLMNEIEPLINTAITAVNEIIVKTEYAQPLLEQYEALLDGEKESIGSDIFTGLEEELRELKKYVATDGKGYDFPGMKDTLQENLSILINTKEALSIGESLLTEKQYQASKEAFINAESLLASYSISGLTLNYSTLVLDKSGQKSPLDEAGNLLQAGILSLVMDTGSLSQAELTNALLPSEGMALSKDNTDFLEQLKSFFENSIVGGSSNTGGLFESFSGETQFASMLGDAINQAAEHLLYQEYLKDHFGMYYPEGAEVPQQKPSDLSYEQEYLLVGKRSDEDNLSSVVSRIIFLRTVFDFVSILGDKTKCNEAKMAASALVGFTGLTILVYITQYIILLVWSFAEALLDTCGLMMGKEVPILKKKVVLELPELFLLNRIFLQSKAEQVTSTKELSFSYHDYLRVFLLLKNKEDLSYRSLDLMQENIKVRYDQENFSIQNCLFGFEAEADFTIESKFTGLAFLKKFFGGNGNAFTYKVKREYSY